MTMGTAWPWKPNDQFKSSTTLIRNLCRIVARNGNYLIGIGPDATGEFDPVVYDRLQELGAWLRLNGEAIFATRPIKPYEQADCVFTRKRDGTIYAVILTDALPESITLPAELATTAGEVELLGAGKLTLDATGKIALPANKPPCAHAWTIKLTPRR
jgi:alpha-L-fucosidase